MESTVRTTVRILPNERNVPPGKLADAEVHFTGGELDGLKLIGFAVWQRRDGNGRNVTFPARQFTVHGERRSFSLLRPVMDPNAQDRIRDAVLRAYTEMEEQVERGERLVGRFSKRSQTLPSRAASGAPPSSSIGSQGHESEEHQTFGPGDCKSTAQPETGILPASLSEREAARYIGMSAAWLKKSRTKRFRGTADAPRYVRAGARRIVYRRVDLDDWQQGRVARVGQGKR